MTASARHLLTVLVMAATSLSTLPVSAETTSTQSADSASTDSEWLSSEQWRALPREERRARSRRSMISRFEPSGQASIKNLPLYLERYAAFNVYDPRYYRFAVKSEPVEGTTGTVRLTGDAYPASYKAGIQDTLEGLGFTIASNDIAGLPQRDLGYGVSTTSAATLRKEPRRNAEQTNSVGLGGWIRFLRSATAADVTDDRTGGHHAPGSESLPEENPDQWALAQTMEGYLGFVRRADFQQQSDYRLPDGILRFPVTSGDQAIPAGAFLYGSPAEGWKLFTGAKLPADAQVTSLKPTFTKEQITSLMKPFMETSYVWGGVTDEGIDCSGFSQFFMRTAGVFIPRDAVQQATGGLIVAWGREQVIQKAQPGDLIFFARETGRVNHVAISLGGAEIIHSAGEGVHISRLDEINPEDASETSGDGVMFARRFTAR